MLCLLWMSHSRTVSSCDPERRSVPSMDMDRHVTRFLRDKWSSDHSTHTCDDPASES